MRKIFSVLFLTISLCANALYYYHTSDGIEFAFYEGSSTCAVIGGTSEWNGEDIPSSISFEFHQEHYDLTVTQIRPYAFYNSKLPGDVVLPNTVTTIGEGAFEGSSIKSIKLADEMFEIEDFAFRDCHNLEKVVMPFNAVKITKGCFANCKSLKKFNFDKISEIEPMAFYSTGLKTVVCGDELNSIANGAFSCCPDLQYVKLGNNTTTIGQQVFRLNTALRCIRIADNVTALPFGCFVSNDKLEVVVLGENMNLVESQSLFAPALQRIYCLNPKGLEIMETGIGTPDMYEKVTLYCPIGSADAYREKTAFVNIVEMDMSNIDELIEPYFEGIDTSSIDAVYDDVSASCAVAPGYYDLQGNCVESPAPGNIYIQCLPDGTSRKILVP